MQIAYRARDITEAHIVAGLLSAHGVEPHVGGHYLQGGLGEIGTMGFSNVYVDDDDLRRARDLVRQYESGERTPLSQQQGDPKPELYARGFLLALALVAVFLLTL